MKRSLLTLCLCVLCSCGGGGLYTNEAGTNKLPDPSENTPTCTTEAKCTVTVTKNAFILGSDFPADIVIPDIDSMRGTAFVVTSSSPSGVIPVDLDTNPLSISRSFATFVAPSGTGFPSSLFIASPTRAFLLTSSHVIDFNPTNGTLNTSVALDMSIDLPATARTTSNGKNVANISPSYPSSLVLSNAKLFVTTSNYVDPVTPASANPGTVLVFNVTDSAPYLRYKNAIVTTDFVPSGLTLLPNGKIAVTNSGVSDLIDAHAEPKTNASIDIIDATTLAVTKNILMGPVGLSFQEMAVTSDGRLGFIGSISYGELYEVDLEHGVALRDHSDPIIISGTTLGSDYLTAQAISHDDAYVFVASFEHSAIFPVDISGDRAVANPSHFSSEPFVIGFPAGISAENPTGENTGAGPLAIRPGKPGTDFTSPDIFATTGYPGTIVAINTHRSGTSVSEDEELTPQPEPIEPDEDDGSVTGDDDDASGGGTTDTGSALFPKPWRLSGELSDYSIAEAFAKKIGPIIGRTENGGITRPEEEPEACRGFAKAIVSVKISKGGGMNFAKLPDIVLGAPEAPTNAAGMAGAQQSVSGVLSLGNGGEITLDMGDCEIADGDGADFTIFENAFFIQTGTVTIDKMIDLAINDPDKLSVFAEPAEVSVSSNGVTFTKFSCDFSIAGSGSFADRSQSGCAGISPVIGGGDPFMVGYANGGGGGDSFDLADIGVEKARYVKIRAAGTFVQPDDPTNPGSGNSAFDLDAVAIINGTK